MVDDFQVPNPVRSVQVIDFPASQSSPRTITDTAHTLGFPKNSVMHTVNVLVHHRDVHRDSQTKASHLTRKIFSMASRMRHERTLLESSMGAMRAVRDRYKKTVVLTREVSTSLGNHSITKADFSPPGKVKIQ